MGRPKEFKVAKSFTLGIAECAWLAKHCHKEKIKASEFMNNLLRTEMLKDKEAEVKQSETHPAYCKHCNDWEPHSIDMICTTCNKLNQELKDRIDKKKKTLQG